MCWRRRKFSLILKELGLQTEDVFAQGVVLVLQGLVVVLHGLEILDLLFEFFNITLLTLSEGPLGDPLAYVECDKHVRQACVSGQDCDHRGPIGLANRSSPSASAP